METPIPPSLAEMKADGILIISLHKLSCSHRARAITERIRMRFSGFKFPQFYPRGSANPWQYREFTRDTDFAHFSRVYAALARN